jgi:ubiquinone/menaquinone biosynthesis C-methylase UbiE
MNSEKSKELSRNAFNRSAANYENTVAGWHSRKMKEAALDRLEQPINGSILDVGCGPGIFLNMLARENGELSLAGLDIAPEMIRVAKERLGPLADLKLGDAESLPWEDNRFNYVSCIDSFHHYPNPARVLREMHRVLRRGGRIVMADPSAPVVMRQIANLLNPLLRRGDVKMYGQREMMSLLDAGGFQQAAWSNEGLFGFVVTAISL